MRLERLLAIVIILISRRHITAGELAERFSVTVRTIYRDIEAISAAGIPVVTRQGQGGGFEIMENYRLSRQVLTFRDMVALIGTFRGVSSILNNEDLQLALDKITSLVPRERRAELIDRCQQVAIDIVPWGPQDYLRSLFASINTAILEQQCVEFSYRDQKSITTTRRVEPMTLLFKGSTWYLFGYCCKRNDYRLFRLSRIRDLKILNQPFERRNQSYEDYLNIDSRTIPTHRILLRCSANIREAIEGGFGPECIVSEEDSYFTVALEMEDSDWLLGMLLSFGSHLEVLEPEFLRQRVIDSIKKVALLYQT